MTNTPHARDITRTTLSVLFIGILIAANLWVLKAFLLPFIWAVIIVVSTWPVLLRIQSAMGGKRGPAVAIMTLALLGLLIAPVIAAALTILEIPDRASALVKSLEAQGLPPLPGWVSAIPFVGAKIAEAWGELASAGREDIAGAWPLCRRYHQLACRSRGRTGDDDSSVPAHRHHRCNSLCGRGTRGGSGAPFRTPSRRPSRR